MVDSFHRFYSMAGPEPSFELLEPLSDVKSIVFIYSDNFLPCDCSHTPFPNLEFTFSKKKSLASSLKKNYL